ncbi:unnamed protein product, partial [Closterium sp. NIES-53]
MGDAAIDAFTGAQPVSKVLRYYPEHELVAISNARDARDESPPPLPPDHLLVPGRSYLLLPKIKPKPTGGVGTAGLRFPKSASVAVGETARDARAGGEGGGSYSSMQRALRKAGSQAMEQSDVDPALCSPTESTPQDPPAARAFKPAALLSGRPPTPPTHRSSYSFSCSPSQPHTSTSPPSHLSSSSSPPPPHHVTATAGKGLRAAEAAGGSGENPGARMQPWDQGSGGGGHGPWSELAAIDSDRSDSSQSERQKQSEMQSGPWGQISSAGQTDVFVKLQQQQSQNQGQNENENQDQDQQQQQQQQQPHPHRVLVPVIFRSRRGSALRFPRSASASEAMPASTSDSATDSASPSALSPFLSPAHPSPHATSSPSHGSPSPIKAKSSSKITSKPFSKPDSAKPSAQPSAKASAGSPRERARASSSLHRKLSRTASGGGGADGGDGGGSAGGVGGTTGGGGTGTGGSGEGSAVRRREKSTAAGASSSSSSSSLPPVPSPASSPLSRSLHSNTTLAAAGATATSPYSTSSSTHRPNSRPSSREGRSTSDPNNLLSAAEAAAAAAACSISSSSTASSSGAFCGTGSSTSTIGTTSTVSSTSSGSSSGGRARRGVHASSVSYGGAVLDGTAGDGCSPDLCFANSTGGYRDSSGSDRTNSGGNRNSGGGSADSSQEEEPGVSAAADVTLALWCLRESLSMQRQQEEEEKLARGSKGEGAGGEGGRAVGGSAGGVSDAGVQGKGGEVDRNRSPLRRFLGALSLDISAAHVPVVAAAPAAFGGLYASGFPAASALPTSIVSKAEGRKQATPRESEEQVKHKNQHPQQQQQKPQQERQQAEQHQEGGGRSRSPMRRLLRALSIEASTEAAAVVAALQSSSAAAVPLASAPSAARASHRYPRSQSLTTKLTSSISISSSSSIGGDSSGSAAAANRSGGGGDGGSGNSGSGNSSSKARSGGGGGGSSSSSHGHSRSSSAILSLGSSSSGSSKHKSSNEENNAELKAALEAFRKRVEMLSDTCHLTYAANVGAQGSGGGGGGKKGGTWKPRLPDVKEVEQPNKSLAGSLSFHADRRRALSDQLSLWINAASAAASAPMFASTSGDGAASRNVRPVSAVHRQQSHLPRVQTSRTQGRHVVELRGPIGQLAAARFIPSSLHSGSTRRVHCNASAGNADGTGSSDDKGEGEGGEETGKERGRFEDDENTDKRSDDAVSGERKDKVEDITSGDVFSEDESADIVSSLGDWREFRARLIRGEVGVAGEEPGASGATDGGDALTGSTSTAGDLPSLEDVAAGSNAAAAESAAESAAGAGAAGAAGAASGGEAGGDAEAEERRSNITSPLPSSSSPSSTSPSSSPSTPSSSSPKSWAHPIAVPETGCVLLAHPRAFGVSQQYFNRAVIFLLMHGGGMLIPLHSIALRFGSPTLPIPLPSLPPSPPCHASRPQGTAGVILNRPSQYTLGQLAGFEELLPEFSACPLYLGGDVGSTSTHCLHGVADLVGGEGGAREVCPGVYVGGYSRIKEHVGSGQSNSMDYRWFARYAGWAPGQLEREVAAG